MLGGSDEGSGWSTLYDGAGKKQGLEVEIPPAAGGQIGMPTGIVFNPSDTFADFQIGKQTTIFLFATLDGTITAWAPGIALNDTQPIMDNSAAGASYTALAVTNRASGNLLFAVNNAKNVVEIYDHTFKHLKNFQQDKSVGADFAVFGARDINGLVFVSYASTTGGAGGFIDIYSEDGILLTQAIHGSPLNQPWGFAVAPKNFGPLSNTLLVSNNTNSGTINAFNALNGQFVGTLKDTEGKSIVIDQLWGIDFGGGAPMNTNGATDQLFFTAGPDNNLAGTFGRIDFVH
ncbi:MAG: TIGR03118 family protein [Acidobacteriaceae bacterium]|nr:TIGR03118 family protein [Acidobacteriaceae bacterium]